MNLFTKNLQTGSSSDQSEQSARTLSLNRFTGGFFAAFLGAVMMLFSVNVNAQACNEDQGGPGYPADPTCEDAVCGVDPFCCDTSWDGLCAGIAEDTFGAGACSACLAASGGGGCTNATLYGTLSPVCGSGPVSSPSDSWTGEYSTTNLTIGEEYTFSSSNATHWISIISNDGTTVLAEGTTPVTWSANAGTVRFATFLNDDCGSTTFDDHTRTVVCNSAAPDGNSCANAVSVSAGTHSAGVLSGTGFIAGCAFTGATAARWYTWTAPGNGDVDIYSCGTLDTRVSVFSGACASLTCVASNDDAAQAYPCQTDNLAAGTSFTATSGTTYLIQWDDRWSTAGFDWNLDFAPAVNPGENCLNTLSAVTGLQTAPAINSAAGGAALNCFPSLATGAVWYEWTAPANGDVDVYSCGTLDTRLSIYNGSCAALNCVASNDDANQAYPCQTGDFAAGTSFEVTGGVTYYIEWDDRWASAGFDWTLNFVAGATGDDCNSAVVVGEGTHAVGGIGITDSASGICDEGGPDAYWFEYTATGDGVIDVYSCGSVDTKLSVHSGNCAALVCEVFNDDAIQAYPCQTGDFAAGLSLTVSNGVTYYIEWDNDWSSAGFTWNLDFNADPGDCVNNNPFGTYTAPTTPVPVQTSTCAWQTEYNTINGISAGESYTNNYTIGGSPNGWITVRSGTPGGPIVAEGNAPLAWVAVDSGTHYIHYNTNDACGTAQTCGVTTITCTSCPLFGCTDDTALNYNPAATDDDGSCILPPCVGTPTNFTFCYGNNANEAFYYQPNTPGEEIAIVFNEGTVEGTTFDNITIYDGNSTSAAVLYTNPTGITQLDGLTVESTQGNGILITFTSDGSASCQSTGSYNQWDYNLYCGVEGVVGCTDSGACNYDPAAGADDGSCFFQCNDTPATAQLVSTSVLGTCSQISGDLLDAQTNAGGSATAFGNDLWYEFVAVSAGVRIETTTTDVDLVLELQDAGGVTLATEDITFTGQPEILNYGALTTGDTYRVRVASYGSSPASGDFNICIQHINGTQCDSAPGSYSLCQLFKAKWAGSGSTNYVFTFTPTGGGSPIVYETNAAFTWAPLSNIPGLLWGADYDVMINVEYTLTNGAGNSETILIENNLECPISINAAPTAVLRPADNLTNAGPLFLGAYIYAQPWACTANGWTWEFVNTDNSQLPIEHYKAGAARVVRLIDVPGLQPGATYDVRVKPEFPTSAPTVYGASDQIAIVGSVGMETEIESPVVMAEDRVEETFEGAAIALYPNPNRGDYVNLNIANIEAGVDRVLVDIYDLAGKRVASEQIAVNASSSLNMVMPLNGIADGMYIVNIIMNGEVHTERMMIQK